jgi:hypothetical protein
MNLIATQTIKLLKEVLVYLNEIPEELSKMGGGFSFWGNFCFTLEELATW